MGKLKFILLAFCAIICFGACSDSDDYGMEFSSTGLYFQWGGEPQTISYTTTNVTSVAVKSITSGWKCDINQTAQTMTITPPAEPETDADRDKMRDCLQSHLRREIQRPTLLTAISQAINSIFSIAMANMLIATWCQSL